MTFRIHHAFALMCLLLLSLQASGQMHYEPQISVGGKAGATLSRTNFSPSVPQSMVTGFIAGGTIRYMEEKHFGLIGEFNIAQHGWKETFEGYNYQFNRRFTYMEIPMLTHIFFGSHKFRGFFNAGPQIGFMIAQSTGSNFDYKNFETIEDFPSTYRNTDQFNLNVKYKFDYGIAAGVGMEFLHTPKQSFVLEGRFYYGLRDVFGNHAKDSFSASNSMSVAITLGYNYRIK